MSTSLILYSTGAVLRSSEVPPVTTFLESQPGAYTTTRTENHGTGLLFWERHLKRLANSTTVLLNSQPELLFQSYDSNRFPSPLTIRSSILEFGIKSLANESMIKVVKLVMGENCRSHGQELAITALVTGNMERLSRNKKNSDEESVLSSLEVALHIGNYVPPVFGALENAARLALVGRGRDVAAAKYSNWVMLRKPLEKLRPPMTTELLLSNDGNRILEGCITNFFVVCRKDHFAGKLSDSSGSLNLYEVQTAPISDGVLPGVIRELVIEVCIGNGIPVREISPSWSERGLWEESFVTSSLRVMQHVEMIKVPKCSWQSFGSKNPEEIQWDERRFQKGPGMITKLIQKELRERASMEGFPLRKFV